MATYVVSASYLTSVFSVLMPRMTWRTQQCLFFLQNSTFERDLNIQLIDDDINEIIQIDGTGDNSSTEDVGSIRDVDENEFPGIVDAGDLTVLEEEADSVSNEDSTANSSDNEDHQIDTMEEVTSSPEPRLGSLTNEIHAFVCFRTKCNSS